MIGCIFMVLFAVFGSGTILIMKPIFDEILLKKSPAETIVQQDMSVSSQVFKSTGLILKKGQGVITKNNSFKVLKQQIQIEKKNFLARNSKRSVLTFLCFLVGFATFFKCLFNYLQKLIFLSVQQKVVMQVRNDVYAKMHEHSLSFFNRYRSGDLISRIMNDVGTIQSLIVGNLTEGFKNFLLVFIPLILILFINWKLTLILFFGFPPILLFLGRIADKLKTYSVRAQEQIAGITSLLQETIFGIRVVLSFGMKDHEINQFKKETLRYYKVFIKMMKYDVLAQPLSEVITTTLGLVVFWYGSTMILSGEAQFTAGGFFVYLGLMFSMMHPIKVLNKTIISLKMGLAVFGRVFELLDEVPEIQELPNAETFKEIKSEIRFNNVHFNYTTKIRTLKGISFVLKKGEVIALVGPSGGGKSTIVDMLPRFYDPHEGGVFIDGIDIRKFTLQSIRKNLGMVTQEVILFNKSIFDNIAYGKPDASEEEVRNAAKAANAHDFILEQGSGYQTVIGERGGCVCPAVSGSGWP